MLVAAKWWAAESQPCGRSVSGERGGVSSLPCRLSGSHWPSAPDETLKVSHSWPWTQHWSFTPECTQQQSPHPSQGSSLAYEALQLEKLRLQGFLWLLFLPELSGCLQERVS